MNKSGRGRNTVLDGETAASSSRRKSPIGTRIETRMAKRKPVPGRSRFTDPIVGRAWLADGTPFSEEDYRRAGLYVPSAEQLAAWEKEDAERARARRRNETG